MSVNALKAETELYSLQFSLHLLCFIQQLKFFFFCHQNLTYTMSLDFPICPLFLSSAFLHWSKTFNSK